jgi:lupus La protein
MSKDKLEKIRSQVEFYFGDANYRVDKFLNEKAASNDGYVGIGVIVDLKRMRALGATVEDVKEALRDSKVVELKNDMLKKIVTEEYLSYISAKDIESRFLYIDGFSRDATLEEIRDTLVPHMNPLLIKRRKDLEGRFTGSVFVELKSAEEVERALEEKISVDRMDEAAKKRKGEEKCLVMKRKSECMKEVVDKIRSQVEFYFSDANYRVDKFLKEQAALNDGYVDIEMLLTFNRMRALGATVEDVKQAIKDSKVVELKNDMVKKVVTEDYLEYVSEKDVESHFLYVCGFSKDATLEDMHETLASHMSPLLIRRRKDKAKNFTGSAFVELRSAEEVEKALKEKIPAGKNGEDYLVVMKKSTYMKDQAEVTEEKKLSEAREALLRDFAPKLYKYECKEEFDIRTIKKLAGKAAFVDTKAKAIRMKAPLDSDELTFKEDGKEIKLTKMSKDEAEEYCKDIKIAPRGSKPKNK